LSVLVGLALAADPATETNKYSFYGLVSSATTVANSKAASFPSSVDTTLYLGDPYSGDYPPYINSEFGLLYKGNQVSVVRASFLLTTSSTWIQSTGTSIAMWLYIVDN
jgi:hypothetical protein